MRIDASSFYDPRSPRKTTFEDQFFLNVSLATPRSAFRIAVPVDEVGRDRRRRYLWNLHRSRLYQNASLREKVRTRRALLRSLVPIA